MKKMIRKTFFFEMVQPSKTYFLLTRFYQERESTTTTNASSRHTENPEIIADDHGGSRKIARNRRALAVRSIDVRPFPKDIVCGFLRR
jgi:hypothetical protein